MEYSYVKNVMENDEIMLDVTVLVHVFLCTLYLVHVQES